MSVAPAVSLFCTDRIGASSSRPPPAESRSLCVTSAQRRSILTTPCVTTAAADCLRAMISPPVAVQADGPSTRPRQSDTRFVKGESYICYFMDTVPVTPCQAWLDSPQEPRPVGVNSASQPLWSVWMQTPKISRGLPATIFFLGSVCSAHLKSHLLHPPPFIPS